MITFNSPFKASRCYSNGTINNLGTYLSVKIDYQSTSLSVYSLQYKRTSASTWTTLVARSSVEYWFNTTYVSTSAILNADYAFDIRITITNDEETAVFTSSVSTGFVLMDLNASGKGIAFGKVSENPNALEIGMDMYDRHGSLVGNGLAIYESGGSTNPNTTTDELILTSVNTPDGGFWFVRTMFYSGKTSSAKRTQVAFPYEGALKSTYIRTYNSGWSAWVEQPVITGKGTSGIWTYRTYSDGTAEAFGKINVSSVTVNSALGGWYRSDVLYSEYAYPFPITFSSAPSVEMMFQTRNSSAALLWTFSSSASNAQYYLPQCYLIRPTTGSGINGNINVIARGTA